MTQPTTIGHTMKRLTAALAAAAMLAGLAACGGGDARTNALDVVASVDQWGGLAAELGGDHVNVTSILSGTNVDAHDYEPTAQDVAAISTADVAVANGAGYDAWAVKAVDNTDVPLVDVAETAGVETGANPHLWFSAEARTEAADAITAAYAKADPDHADAYQRLNKAWRERESELETRIAETAETLDGIDYAATESVAGYLAESLGLTNITPKGYTQAAANESEPTPGDVRAFVELLEQGGAGLLVVNTQETNSTVESLVQAAETGGVPTVDVTEQMPADYTDLVSWIGGLVDQIAAARG